MPRILESRGIAGNVGQAAAAEGMFLIMLGGWLDCRWMYIGKLGFR